VNTRRITLIVAVVLAIGTGILTLRYLTSIQQQANVQQQQVELKRILVASRDIPARAKITPDMLTSITRPATQVEPGALEDPKQAQGDIALITIPSGSTITETRVGRPAEVGLTVRLKPGMRAISIPVDRVKAVSGLLQPGDRVDVLASVPRGQGSQPKAVTIIRGAMVLAINDTLETAGATPSPDAANLVTVTLGVTPQQADLLTMADLNTTLRLALRSPQEPVRSLPAEHLELPDNSAAAAPEPAANNVPPPVQPAIAPSIAVPPPTVPHVAPVNPVTVIDGDRVVTGQQ
jgi:pilus assembly protein CpaB